MPRARYVPTITKSDFGFSAARLRAELKRKYDASKSDAERPPGSAGTVAAFDHVPDLDSKTVARWSSTIKAFLGCKLDPTLIRKGGYESFDDFWQHMAPQLLAICRDDAAPVSEDLSLGVAP